MKLEIILLTAFLGMNAFAEDLPLERLGHPVGPIAADVRWNAPTNKLPEKVWTYRIVPTDISPAVISNLLVLGLFTPNEKKEIPGSPKIISYADSTGKRQLWIDPQQGYARYVNPDAEDMNIINGVPSEKRAYKLTARYLPQLGISLDQLASKRDGSNRQVHYIQRTAVLYKGLGQPAYATNLYLRGIIFNRRLDGIEFLGLGVRGGCTIEYGHDEKVSELELFWPKMVREQSYAVASPDDFLNEIRQGKFVWEPSDVDVDWLSVKRLTITKVMPYYYGEGHGEYSSPRNLIYPFAQLEATIETAETNSKVLLNCPIFAEMKP